jgi:hypothetical protein
MCAGIEKLVSGTTNDVVKEIGKLLAILGVCLAKVQHRSNLNCQSIDKS